MIEYTHAGLSTDLTAGAGVSVFLYMHMCTASLSTDMAQMLDIIRLDYYYQILFNPLDGSEYYFD